MSDTYTTKLWGGRFREDEDALMRRFNSECWRTDWLVEPDIEGSLAHVAMLEKCGLLTREECEAIRRRFLNDPMLVYKGVFALLTGDTQTVGELVSHQPDLFQDT